MLTLLTGVGFSNLKRIIRSLPAEFGIYYRNGKAHVKYFQGAAGTARADAGRGQRKRGPKDEFHCDVCNQSFESADNLQQHNSSTRHRVNLLAQQLKSSGSFHANLQGLQVSEFEEGSTLEVSRVPHKQEAWRLVEACVGRAAAQTADACGLLRLGCALASHFSSDPETDPATQNAVGTNKVPLLSQAALLAALAACMSASTVVSCCHRHCTHRGAHRMFLIARACLLLHSCTRCCTWRSCSRRLMCAATTCRAHSCSSVAATWDSRCDTPGTLLLWVALLLVLTLF